MVLHSIVGERVADHNYDRRHSTLDFRTSIAVLRDLSPAAVWLPTLLTAPLLRR